MSMMCDSDIDERWLAEVMTRNPPKELDDGTIFSGPVRLSFANIFKPATPKNNSDGGAPKYGATLLFPPQTNMRVFSGIWTREARLHFPKNWTAQGQPIGLHMPFHDQVEKTVGAQPYAGFTPGAVYFASSSKFKPLVVDTARRPILDEAAIYSGVWVVCSLNHYHYSDKKTGIGFGLQMLMKIADDRRLGGGVGDPEKAFASVQISAQSNIAEQFNAAAGLMPGSSHAESAGALPIRPISELSLSDL